MNTGADNPHSRPYLGHESNHKKGDTMTQYILLFRSPRKYKYKYITNRLNRHALLSSLGPGLIHHPCLDA